MVLICCYFFYRKIVVEYEKIIVQMIGGCFGRRGLVCFEVFRFWGGFCRQILRMFFLGFFRSVKFFREGLEYFRMWFYFRVMSLGIFRKYLFKCVSIMYGFGKSWQLFRWLSFEQLGLFILWGKRFGLFFEMFGGFFVYGRD